MIGPGKKLNIFFQPVWFAEVKKHMIFAFYYSECRFINVLSFNAYYKSTKTLLLITHLFRLYIRFSEILRVLQENGYRK